MMEEARERRLRLLDKRRDLREQEGEEFETVQMLLKEVSSLVKEARKKVNEQRTAELEEEMSEAWRNRQFALLHSLRVEYARNGRGPKKRYCFSPRTVWDREDWIRDMAKPASKGGMGCSELDWERNYNHYVRQCKGMANEELPDDLNAVIAVIQGKAAILRYARKAPKRRAFPAWGIPAEALLLISDRQCNIETPDTTTDKYLKAQARRTRTERADPQGQSQAAHNTATRQENEVRMSAEQEAEMKDRRKCSKKPLTGVNMICLDTGSRGMGRKTRRERSKKGISHRLHSRHLRG